MPTALLPEGRQRYYNNDGTPAAGGKLYTYAAGTTNPKVTYADEAGTVANPNPLTLDAKGEAVIYWSGAYKADLKQADGVQVTGYPVDNIKTDPGGLGGILASLAASTGAALIGAIYNAVGAVKRTLQDIGRERVSVLGFAGVDPTGAADSLAGLQNAINFACSDPPKKLIWPGGSVFKISGSLKIPATGSGAVWGGDSWRGVYLKTDGGVFPLVKVAASYTRISGLIFRPGAAQPCVQLYAANCDVSHNQFLSAVNNSGTAILLSDTDPDTGAFVGGAYTHTIRGNIIGVAGYAFAHAVEDATTAGAQACKIKDNAVISDSPFKMLRGGANIYSGNLLQSSTMGGTGNGIDIGANVNGETVTGNYFEGFANGVLIRTTDTTVQAAHVTGNHFDACTAKVTGLASNNYFFADEGGALNLNGWQLNYSTPDVFRIRSKFGYDCLAMDSNGHVFFNAATGASHVINARVAVENDTLVTFNGQGTNAAYLQHVTGTGPNGANTGIACKANSVTGRSINAGGTLNASGADYAEYIYKAAGVGAIAKGQIVGITAQDEVTDQWADAVAFAIKSTNPSYVGGDVWASHLGPRPTKPGADATAEDVAAYETADAAYNDALEAARQSVDRIAIAGRVPVNVLGAVPGQYLVAEADGTGVKGVPVAAPTFEQYQRAVGKVVALEPDGRARVLVKTA